MYTIPLPKPATTVGTSSRLGGYFFLERQDHKISIIDGFILAVLTLAAGISVFVVMQRQAESLLRKSLGVSLQSNVRWFESRIDQVPANTHTATVRPFVIKNLQLLASNPGYATAQIELQRVAQSFLLTDFTGDVFFTMFVVMKWRVQGFFPTPPRKPSPPFFRYMTCTNY